MSDWVLKIVLGFACDRGEETLRAVVGFLEGGGRTPRMSEA